MKTEAQVREEIRRESISHDVILFPNPSGVGFMGDIRKPESMRRVAFGLGKGASDLIGIKKTVITHDMVGKSVGIFVAIEVKKEDWNPSRDEKEHHAEQVNFLARIKAMGGISGFCKSAIEFKNLIARIL